LGEEVDTLVDVVEPYLLQTGLVQRTRQGRRATRPAYDHLKIEWNPAKQDLEEAPLYGDFDARSEESR
jgi:Holliday junction DNA helicase RuvB